MSLEFKKKKLERPIYVKNMDSIFNHEEQIEYMVEIELFYKEHKKKTKIYWKTREVKMTRCLDECGK